MGNIMKRLKNISLTALIFFIVAFLFLAVGLGSLGTVRGTGKAYELRVHSTTNAKEPVTFELKNPSYVKDGKTVTDYYMVRHVYLNVAAIYNEEDESAKITLGRGASTTASSFTYESNLGNLKFKESTQGEKKERYIENAVGNWIEPFDLTVTDDSNLRVATYKYYKLTAATCNLLINEIVFVGEQLLDEDGNSSVNGEPSGKLKVIPAEIYYAPPMLDGEDAEKEDEATAKKRASALIDAQHVPSMAQSSFFRLGTEEIYSMTTVAEMRLGNVFYKSGSNKAVNVYHGDSVYNSLGTSILGLGVAIFGNSPFGLRFFPMLASFGVLMFGYFFVKELCKSEKAGLVFAVLYALSNFFLGLGHFGTPLTIGLFFFTASLYFMYRFYNRGIRKTNVRSLLPLISSGLLCAGAVCVNGVYILAALAVVGLFAAGMVRQNRARRLYLDQAIAVAEEVEARESAEPPVLSEEGEPLPKPLSESKRRVLEIVDEYKWKNSAALAAFGTALVVGGMLLSLLFLLPVYFPYVKLYDNPNAPRLNLFQLMGKLFAGGFVGSNGGTCAYHPFYRIFAGAGSMYGVTAVVMNTVALLIGLLGVAYAVYKIVLVCMKKIEGKEARIALRRAVVPLGLIVTGAVLGSFGGGALAFIALVYLGMFALAAECVRDACEREWAGRTAAKICVWVGLGLLCATFLVFAVFTFSIPLPAIFVGNFV